MPGKRLVQLEKVPHTLEIQGRIAEQLKAQYDDAGPVPHRLAELLKQLAQLELLKELTQLMDEPDSGPQRRHQQAKRLNKFRP